MTRLLAAMAACLALFVVSACAGTAELTYPELLSNNRVQIQNLEVGMTKAEVRAVLGKGDVVSLTNF